MSAPGELIKTIKKDKLEIGLYNPTDNGHKLIVFAPQLYNYAFCVYDENVAERFLKEDVKFILEYINIQFYHHI